MNKKVQSTYLKFILKGIDMGAKFKNYEQLKEQNDLFIHNQHEKLNISIIDDDEMCLKLTKHHLETVFKGVVDVKTFTSFKEYELFGKNADIAIVDYAFENQLQQIDGLTMLLKLKTKKTNTLMYMLTAHKQMHLAVQAMKNGASDYIVKGEDAMGRLSENILEIIKRKNTYNKRVSFLEKFRKRLGLI